LVSIVEETQSVQFADMFNKISLFRPAPSRFMNSSFHLVLEVPYAVRGSDISWRRKILNIFAGRAAQSRSHLTAPYLMRVADA
jgi:hypothetical protein